MSRDYFNTNDEAGGTLADSRDQARKQQTAILTWFQEHPGRHFGPHEIPMPPGTPLTSVRRAITNLTEAGILEKNDIMTMGTFRKLVHTWRLRQEEARELGFDDIETGWLSA